MTKEEPHEEATLPCDPNKSDSSPLPKSKGVAEADEQSRENSGSPHESRLSKSPTGSSSGFPSRSGSNIDSEVSETELYIRSKMNKANDLGSEDSFLSYRSDEEPPKAPKRRSESFDDGASTEKVRQTKKSASDLIGLASKNFPYYLTERQKAMIHPRYKTERIPDLSKNTMGSKEKLAAVDYHSIDLPVVTPEQIRAIYYGSSQEESGSSVHYSVLGSSSQPSTETGHPISPSDVDAFVESHRDLYNFKDEERIGVYPGSVDGEEDDGALGSSEGEPEVINSRRDKESVNDESEGAEVEERCPTSELSKHDSDDSKSVDSPADR